MGTLVLDASVLIAFIQPDDAHHTAAGQALLEAQEEHRFSVPVSAMAEALVGAARLGGRDLVTERHRAIEDVFGFARPVDDAVAVEAAMLRGTHKALRLPDALVLATGIVDDAAVLTADKKLAKVYDRVQVLGTT